MGGRVVVEGGRLLSRRGWLVEAGCLLVVDILVTLVTLILGVGIPAPCVVPVALFYVRALLVEPIFVVSIEAG